MNKMIERKAGDMHWKSLTYGLCTEEKQKKMRLSDGFCKLCTVDIESIEHLFYECELVERIWPIISKLTMAIWSVNCAHLKDVILIPTQKHGTIVGKVLVFVIVSTKWIIWKRRNLVKYEHKWTDVDSVSKWILAYISKRSKLLLKTKTVDKETKSELSKLIEAIDKSD